MLAGHPTCGAEFVIEHLKAVVQPRVPWSEGGHEQRGRQSEEAAAERPEQKWTHRGLLSSRGSGRPSAMRRIQTSSARDAMTRTAITACPAAVE
ncbi:hypothetical protein SAMN05216377_12289 [Pseudonocardia oroxyli]|uniref:Uncharacterized protein n=1 Tax=Pseudonocardia oroxyli TaxID=366584 RepID=A0A1G8CGC8_PSEOR|nr:hypothetical protein SAMN05216377_12289 [Pseudonocardia oroxyli]